MLLPRICVLQFIHLFSFVVSFIKIFAADAIDIEGEKAARKPFYGYLKLGDFSLHFGVLEFAANIEELVVRCLQTRVELCDPSRVLLARGAPKRELVSRGFGLIAQSVRRQLGGESARTASSQLLHSICI